jgi:hypothetical protein
LKWPREINANHAVNYSWELTGECQPIYWGGQAALDSLIQNTISIEVLILRDVISVL